MRFLFSKIFKNVPLINHHWLSFLGYIDAKHFKKISLKYKIIPFGCYCLPRVITTINRLKPTRKHGEESFPFDLCFSDFNSNLHFLSSEFQDFFDNLTFDNKRKYWINEKYNLVFNHDHLSLDEFKERYNKRIKNFYSALNNKSKYIYFVIATFQPITNLQVKSFIDEINKYRNSMTYSIIIINQSTTSIKYNDENVYSIDLTQDKCFDKINGKGLWAMNLKKMKSFNARFFNYKVNSKLSKIIR